MGNSTVLFVADGDRRIGYGHVSRCLVLANVFVKNGSRVFFMQKKSSLFSEKITTHYPLFKVAGYEDEHQREIKSLIKSNQINHVIIDLLEEDYLKLEWLRKWFKNIKITSITLYLFPDFERYEHLSFFPDISIKKKGYQEGKYGFYFLFAGPQYFIFRDEFKDLEKEINKNAKSVLVTMGGTDPYNISLKVIRALQEETQLNITIVLSGLSNCFKRVKEFSKKNSNVTLIEETDEMAKLMLESDLIILNGGMTRYEACLAKTPFIAISIHEKQFDITKRTTDLGLGINLGVVDKIEPELIKSEVKRLLSDEFARKEMSKKMADTLDTNGAIRIYYQILEPI